jgi:peptidoglycan/xylan/chitin deacetylase (PgdA/CDA1 family)
MAASTRAVRSLVGKAAATRGFERVVDLLERFDRPRESMLAVLTYHRVAAPGEEPELDPGLISASPFELEQQMRYLAATGRVVSIDELLAARRGQARLPPGAIAVTVDDAYRDFAEHVWPTMRRYGLPVTLFVPTGYPDRPERTFWWDRLHHALSAATGTDALETPVGWLPLTSDGARRAAFTAIRDRLKRIDDAEARVVVDRLAGELDAPPQANSVLGWDALRGLREEGVALAPHTRTHAFLDQVSLEQAREEIAGSRADLEREVGGCPPVFSFPSGQHTDDLVRILEEEGFEIAFTTGRGVNDLWRPDWLRMRRINVGGRSTLPVIRAQLLSFAPGMAR